MLIIADGQVLNVADTVAAIVEASHLPLSIVMVGVGDGPWDMMKSFDDDLPQRRFDNFQFCQYNPRNPEAAAAFDDPEGDARFALQALMEIPDQFRAIRALGMLG